MERWFFDQALDQVGAPRPPAQSYVDLIGPALLQHGSEAQRDRFLRPMVNGDELWCQGFSEPGAGSDLAALRTEAERRGDEYVVNGQKVWTSHADIADWCFLLCRTEPDAPKHKGISLLLVDMKTPGITVRPLRQMTDDAEFCEVFFEDVRVPADEPPRRARRRLEHRHGHRRARARPDVDVRLPAQDPPQPDPAGRSWRASTRPAPARCDDPLVRQRLAQAHIEVELLRLMRLPQPDHAAAHRPSRPRELAREGASAARPTSACRTWRSTCSAPYGALRDGERALGDGAVPRQFLYARSETIMGGTSEIQRNVIAQRILGLPR